MLGHSLEAIRQEVIGEGMQKQKVEQGKCWEGVKYKGNGRYRFEDRLARSNNGDLP